MPMNLVAIALEGVSQTLFWEYREAMPTLWELSERGAVFRRFYSASTSAFQSFCDFAHGDAGELDHNLVYPSGPGCLAGRAANLFAILRDKGYAVHGLMRANPAPAYAKNNFWNAWPEGCGLFQCHGDYAGFYAASDAVLDRAGADGAPFALYLSDRAARPGDETPEKAEAPLYHERFEKGFALLDRSIRRVMDGLAARNLLADTIVALFGPYGMDPWKHGIHLGRTHAVDPYADMCWTPLIIFRNGADAGIADPLASVIDLKPTLLRLLFPETPPSPPDTPLAGLDILNFRRQAAFSQNLFALEREGEGPARGLAKCYAVTDGEQRLMAASEKASHGEGGMELYFDPRDPGNTRNFLDFFDLDANGTMTAFGRSNIVHVHFARSFKPNLTMGIVASYNRMRPWLYEYVRIKERNALELAGPAGAANVLGDEVFARKRKRK